MATAHDDPKAEAELLDAVRAGDDRAIATLVERYAPAVLRFGMKLCHDEQDARDVVQDTLLAAARNLRSYRGDSRLSTWLYTIARSFCIKHRTRGAAREPVESLDALNDAARDQLLVDPRAAPDEQLARRQLQAQLEQAIRALEPTQREVLVLRDVEGLEASEVAKVLDLSVEAVKSRLHRARRALREALVPAFGGVEPPPGRDCPDVIALLSQHMEDDVSPELCRSMEAHVASCPQCAARCDSLRRALSLCGSMPAPELTPALRAEVASAIRQIVGSARLAENRP